MIELTNEELINIIAKKEDLLDEKEEEIKRLNNIIDELEKYLEEIKDRVIMYGLKDDTYKTTNLYNDIKKKIKELKEKE